MIWGPAIVYDFYIYIYMSLLFASNIIDYLLHWRINLQIVLNKYHICFLLICFYNKIISLSAQCFMPNARLISTTFLWRNSTSSDLYISYCREGSTLGQTRLLQCTRMHQSRMSKGNDRILNAELNFDTRVRYWHKFLILPRAVIDRALFPFDII